jgi:hypothetical protein
MTRTSKFPCDGFTKDFGKAYQDVRLCGVGLLSSYNEVSATLNLALPQTSSFT